MTGEQGYLELLNDCLTNGDRREGRNGVTRSLFGRQLRFNLADGFPLLTTKKVHFKSLAIELLWFLRGDTNATWLEERGVNIWREWGDPETREMGPIYGFQFRKFGARPRAIPRPEPRLPTGISATYLGVANGTSRGDRSLKKTWEGMIARCYDPNSPSYGTYGRRGVHVVDHWLEYANFAEDARNLPGWERKISDHQQRYVLDKDYRGNGFRYGPEDCCWITDAENIEMQARGVHVVERDGEYFSFFNASRFCAEQGICDANFSDLWTGNKNATVRCGFRYVRFVPFERPIDQIAQVVESIRSDPYGRRHVVSAWNPADIDKMALPPCHCLFQFHVDTQGRLSCHLYQRSADIFLGVPFNIASYALLTHMMAWVTDKQVGDLIISFGDVHLYENHVEQAQEQLSREPRALPKLILHPDAPRTAIGFKALADWEFHHFAVWDYDPHPAIAAPVSA